MSLAPASNRGAFLKARLAVNGIQCAARSLGTLTAAGSGLLSSMGASSSFGAWRVSPKLSASRRYGNAGERTISAHSARSGAGRIAQPASQIAGADPEHFGLGILGLEPKQRQLRKRGLEHFAATADFAQQPALRRQMLAGLLQDAADDIEPVGAAIERELRLGAAFARQALHALRVDIGRVGNDQVVTDLAEGFEQIAPTQCHALLKTVVGDIACGDIECVLGDVHRIDPRIRKT